MKTRNFTPRDKLAWRCGDCGQNNRGVDEWCTGGECIHDRAVRTVSRELAVRGELDLAIGLNKLILKPMSWELP